MMTSAKPQRSKKFRIDTLKISVFVTLLAAFVSTASAGEDSSFSLLSAHARGTTVSGPEKEKAKGIATPTFDETTRQDVLEFDYTLSENSSLRVWTKDFSSELNSHNVNTAKIGVRVSSAEEASQLALEVEIQGTQNTQTIPLKLKPGWNSERAAIDWAVIGDLKEIAFILTPAEGTTSARGTLYLALDVIQVAEIQSPPPAQEAASEDLQGEKLEEAVEEAVVESETGIVVAPPAAPILDEKEEAHYEESAEAEESAPTEERMVADAPTIFDLLSAHKRGVQKNGSAKGNVLPTFDSASEKNVLEFDYTLSENSSLRVWTKDFSSELNSHNVNTAKIGVRVSSAEEASQLALEVEIQGTQNTQTIPLKLKPGWNSERAAIDWAVIGDLKEIAFILTPAEGTTSARGTLYLALDVMKLSFESLNAGPSEAFSSFGFLDAEEKGVFNIGPSQGSIKTAFDKTIARDVWQFDYVLPMTAVVGVWSKSFPVELEQNAVDAVEIGVRVPSADQIEQVFVKMEIKGARAMQTIPLCLKPGQNVIRESINWGAIGELREVVFVVSPMAPNPIWFNRTQASLMEADKPATGTLCFYFGFGKMTFWQRNFAYEKAALVLITSLLLAFLGFFLARWFSRRSPRQKRPVSQARPDQATPSDAPSAFSRLKMDFFYGVMCVFLGGATFAVYLAGTRSNLDGGFSFSFLAIAAAGVMIAGLFKSIFTGKPLTALEVFRNVFVSGLLAVASSRQEILQPPASWMQVLVFSNVLAAITFLIYHVSNARSLASSGKHLKGVATALIVGTPYLFNWLLLVENGNLLQALIGRVSVGILAAWPTVLEDVGRVLVVFGFNEAITNGIRLSLKGRMLETWKAHLTILAVSIGAVLAPNIADWGSTAVVASMPDFVRILIVILTTMFSFAGLWGEVYLVTGVSLDFGNRAAPSQSTISKHIGIGMRKGMAYSGILMAILYTLHFLLDTPLSHKVMMILPVVIGVLAGSLLFPFVKTIIETFDGSLPFFERLRYSYRHGTLYARGAVVGFGFSYAITHGLFQQGMAERIPFGLMIGLGASGGVSILRDLVYALKHQGRIQTWRLYLIDSFLGAFVGSAVAFYLDALQVPVVIEKFKLYTSSGFSPAEYITYPLLNKWGRIDLGSYTGGVKLLYTESLAGVINWSIAAWLFAINKVFMQAYFDKDKTPIKFFFSKEGFAQLIEHMIYVLRWGLWMSPIIFTFLRMMPEPTWYNQDGAIRTLFALYHNATMSPAAFQEWSLKIFVYVLAFDFFRILIWMDHMGLRVATLVNLSFLGLDKLDEKVARFIGPATAQRCIPEGVKRFATWAPLLIPFYLPRGGAWDYAWSTSEAIQNASRGRSILSAFESMDPVQLLSVIASAILIFTGISFVIRSLCGRSAARRIKTYELRNREYKVVLRETGETYSEIEHHKADVYPREYDLSRRAYDMMDPCGRLLYLVDTSEGRSGSPRFWPIVGNYPKEKFEGSHIERFEDSLKIVNQANGVRATVEIHLPDEDTAAEIWTIKLENLTESARTLKMVPYLEWVLNGGLHDRFHTQYARLFPEMEYVRDANAVLSWHKGTKAMGILAASVAPEGFMTSRMDFVGRARSIWSPRVLEALDFMDARDTAPYPTFDPIGSLLVNFEVPPQGSETVRLMMGYAKNKQAALDLIQKYLKPVASSKMFSSKAPKKFPLIGHGEIPSGTPQPYYEFVDRGSKLLVRTPYTPRPFDHAMSNAIHSVMVTNRGLHTSCNGNSQQNRLTPDWPDTVTKETPTEAIYLYDPDKDEWYSPTFLPLGDTTAKYESEFGVDGTAVFRMTQRTIATELTVFVPPDEPMGVYLLTVRNYANYTRRMRVAPYFHMVLAFQPERSGPLVTEHDQKLGALFFENPRNMFRSGWAFASMSLPSECTETKRGRFFGMGRGPERPFLVEKGEPDAAQLTDDGQIAAFLGTLDVPAHGERTVAVVLGQADTKREAVQLVQKYKKVETVRESLEETKKWWLGLMETVSVETNRPDFDRYLQWLKYQALAERIWARRGFYQTSGAYGFRDQLQDTVNLIWADPALARKQIILHASHQFLEGDVFHWFFTLTDGRTAFSCRSHASDNPIWLSWGVAEYVRATGDESILDEMASYVMSEFPFAGLPKNKQGWGHLYHRTTRADSVYRHCMRSIDLVIEKRTGEHGLPLMGTGDWNDGLDEIGSEGKGESVWLGFFLYYILKELMPVIEKKDGLLRKAHYTKKSEALRAALESTWRNDRYLRAFHDDGTEIGIKGSGVWEIDALTAAWAVMSGINFERGLQVFDTAIEVLEKDNAILLGWPALREDTKPYLGRSSKYPEGVRENGMYCHGVQWLVRAARLLAEEFEKRGDAKKADKYRATAYRLWLKISPMSHIAGQEIEIYGGQPNKQSADILTNFDLGRMIWHGYTGAAGWMLRQAMEGVVGASLAGNKLTLPLDLEKPRGELKIHSVRRDVRKSPLGLKAAGRLGTLKPSHLHSETNPQLSFPKVTASPK